MILPDRLGPHPDDGAGGERHGRPRDGDPAQPGGPPEEVPRGDHKPAAALDVGGQLIADLVPARQLPGNHQQRIPREQPARRVAEQAVDPVAVGRRRDESRLVVIVRRVGVPRIEHLEHIVGQVVARRIGQVAPDAIDAIRIEVARKGPAREEVGHEGDRREHDARRAVRADPSLRRLLDPADRREGIAFEETALETDDHAVVQDVGVHQPLEEAQARAERRAMVGPRRTVGLVAPAVEDGCIAEPRDAILLARPADECVVDLDVGQGLGRLGADQRIDALLEEVVAVIERHERGHAVAELLAHPLEVALEVEVLLEPVRRARRHLPGIAADVAPVLLAVVHAEPAGAEPRLEHLEHADRGLELLPVAGRAGARHVTPDVEQEQITPPDFVGQVGEVRGEQDAVPGPDHLAQIVHPRVAVKLFPEVHERSVFHSEAAEAREARPPAERVPVRRLDVPAVVVRVLARIEQARVDAMHLGRLRGLSRRFRRRCKEEDRQHYDDEATASHAAPMESERTRRRGRR